MEVTRSDLENVVYGVDKRGKPIHSGTKHVRVEPGRLVATDGMVLIVRELEHSGKKFEPFCVSVKDVRAALKDKTNHSVWESGGTVQINSGNEFMAKIGHRVVAKQDTGYVKWEKILKGVRKTRKGAVMARFNPEVLMRALQGMKDADNVELRVWKDDEAVRLDGRAENGRQVMSLVMPLILKT